MKVEIKIAGQTLFDFMKNEAAAGNLCSPPLTKRDRADWSIRQTSELPTIKDVLCTPDAPTVLLIQANDASVIEQVEALEERTYHYLRNNPHSMMTLAPVIVVFSSHEALRNLPEFSDYVSDWTYLPVSMNDLMRRISLALRRRSVLKSRTRYGAFTVVPDSRTLMHDSDAIHLSPTEFFLAEMFLRQRGAVIGIKELVIRFQEAGKSTQSNNIRVSIFQLRLKLELLTHGRMTLVSVYKQGYCLRQKNCESPLEAVENDDVMHIA
jgi:DNA-binding response OmpR family regulator